MNGEQAAIDFSPPAPAAAAESPLDAAFRTWSESADGRTVYRAIRSKALALRARGWRHFGIRPLWEAVRYDRSIEVGPDGGFKLNDHHHSRLARLLMAREPELDGFFDVRELRS